MSRYLWVEADDNLQIHLQTHFIPNRLHAKRLYVRQYGKMCYVIALVTHLLVVERSMDLSLLPPYISGQSTLELELKLPTIYLGPI